METTITRRSFLGTTALAGTALGLGGQPAAARIRQDAAGKGLNLLILGGTGFLGPHVVEEALARGHTMTLFNRGRTNPGLFPELEKLRGDRDPDVGEGLSALEGRTWDAVVDTSAYFPRIARASAEVLGKAVEHYVLVSTISVYASFEREGMDEKAPVGRLEDESTETIDGATYGPLKALCEEAVEDVLPGRVCNVRPGLIVGPRDTTDRFTYWPVRVERGGEVLAPPADDPVQYVDVRDLARWIVHTIEKRVSGVFNATGPEHPLTVAGLLHGCRAVTGGDARFVFAPTDFLTEQGVSAWADLPAWTPSEGELRGLGTVDCGRAIEAGLGFRPLADTVRDTLAWFHAEPAGRQASLRAGLVPEREAQVLAAWRDR